MGEVSPLNELYRRFRAKDFEFFTIYVREPHPGQHYHEHRSWEQKVQYARDCREQDGIESTLLVDDLQGTVHRLYGEMPNMVYVIMKDGRIAYRAMWTHHVEIESVLENLVHFDAQTAAGARVRASYVDKLAFIPVYGDAVRQKVFGRAGPKSEQDYRAAFKGGR